MPKAKTIMQRPNIDGFPKPGELIELKSSNILSLESQRIFSALLENAWNEIDEDKEHEISVVRLRGSHKGSERVADSLKALRNVEVGVPTKVNGKEAIIEMPLIAQTTRHINENDRSAVVKYYFTPKMRQIIRDSNYWGRIKILVCFAFSSRYAYSLYEAICLRANRRATSEFVRDDDFRRMLGVAKDKYTTYSSFKQRVLDPALLEVNKLSEFNVQVFPERDGGNQRGRLVGWHLSWDRKEASDWEEVLRELQRTKVGRKARISGNAVAVS